jgi:hypothetical protein
MLLEAHVRFEERELFPALERHWNGSAQPADLTAVPTKPTRKMVLAAGLGRAVSDARPHLPTHITP